jgi:nicotinamide mononucleotide adenylyltransferase
MVRECGAENSLIVIGSTNNPFSMRHFFSYSERKNLIRRLYPTLKVVGHPDYFSDEAWLEALDDILSAMEISPAECVYYGGSTEDVRFFIEAGRNCKITSRFAPKQKNISATEVRDALLHGDNRYLKESLDPRVIDEIKERFTTKWAEFKRI